MTGGAADRPADVDLRDDPARVGALHDDLPRALEHAVVQEPGLELRLVVVEVRRAEAGLDRALAEAVEQLAVASALWQRVVSAGAAGNPDSPMWSWPRIFDATIWLSQFGLGQVAVAAGEAQAVLVAKRAQRVSPAMLSGVAGFVPGNGLPG